MKKRSKYKYTKAKNKLFRFGASKLLNPLKLFGVAGSALGILTGFNKKTKKIIHPVARGLTSCIYRPGRDDPSIGSDIYTIFYIGILGLIFAAVLMMIKN